jgi:anthranilate/para-aminobenzoate synthase component I
MIYRAVRSRAPSPYLSYLKCGDFDLIASAPCAMARVRDGEWSDASHQGLLEEGETAFGVVRNFFPALVVSGAYQHPAMELIDRHEQMSRNAYGGAVGYFDLAGNADFAPVYGPNVLVKDGYAYTYAGSLVTQKSLPHIVYAETWRKDNNVFEALHWARAGLL